MTFGRAFLMLACLFVPCPGAFVLLVLAVQSTRSNTRTLARALLGALALLLLLLIALRLIVGPTIGMRLQEPRTDYFSARLVSELIP